MENGYEDDKGNDKMKTISFDEDGRPVAVSAAEEAAPEAEEAVGQAAENGDAGETAEAAKAEHHRPNVRELKQKISELSLQVEVLESELENARKENETYIDFAKRTKADFDNFKKRNAEQNQRMRGEGLADGVLHLLPVYDALIKASEMITDQSTLKGLAMIAQRLSESLKELGVEKIESLGQNFDPAFHNAVMNEEAESEDMKGKVTGVYQEGFMMGDRVLRYAMVKVAI